MSQSGYLVVAFAIVVVTIVVWAGIMLAKFARLRRDAGTR
jgi:hypothetical protein